MSHAGPHTLDHAGIESRIPHSGRMCLLDRMTAWTDTRVECLATGHRDLANPLRTHSGLLASAAIEYAAQAMALHGALTATAAGAEPAPGFLASARDVNLRVWRLDDLCGDLHVVANRVAADAGRILYAFTIRHEGAEIASGRVAVVLGMAAQGAAA